MLQPENANRDYAVADHPVDRLASILAKAAGEAPLTEEEAVALFEGADLFALGRLANEIRNRKTDPQKVGFVIDRNINYTNVCETHCKFCNFYRPVGHSEGYVLPMETLLGKIEELVQTGGTQILLQGGHNPALPLDYYLDLLRGVKARFPNVTLHAFSPPEIDFIAGVANLSLKELISRLMEAGLDSIPGGGAEILEDEIRQLVSPEKIGADRWLEVMETAHGLGLKTSATMMWGDYCRPIHIVRHLLRLRDLQARTGGFTAFIPWTFQAEGAPLGRQHKQSGVTAFTYLRVLAFSRILLPNIPNLQVSWVTQGPKVAQTALRFGANDFGGTMMEENVVSAAGADHGRLTGETVIDLVRRAGYLPYQRDTQYRVVRTFDDE